MQCNAVTAMLAEEDKQCVEGVCVIVEDCVTYMDCLDWSRG